MQLTNTIHLKVSDFAFITCFKSVLTGMMVLNKAGKIGVIASCSFLIVTSQMLTAIIRLDVDKISLYNNPPYTFHRLLSCTVQTGSDKLMIKKVHKDSQIFVSAKMIVSIKL